MASQRYGILSIKKSFKKWKFIESIYSKHSLKNIFAYDLRLTTCCQLVITVASSSLIIIVHSKCTKLIHRTIRSGSPIENESFEIWKKFERNLFIYMLYFITFHPPHDGNWLLQGWDGVRVYFVLFCTISKLIFVFLLFLVPGTTLKRLTVYRPTNCQTNAQSRHNFSCVEFFKKKFIYIESTD